MNEGQAIASSGEEPPAYPVPNSPSNFPQAFEANLNAELRSPTSSLNSPAMPVNSNAHVQTVNRHHDDKNVAAAKKPAPILVSVGELFPAGLQVPSKHKSMASGFAFPPQLGRIGMDERAWSRFTHDICKIAKMYLGHHFLPVATPLTISGMRLSGVTPYAVLLELTSWQDS